MTRQTRAERKGPGRNMGSLDRGPSVSREVWDRRWGERHSHYKARGVEPHGEKDPALTGAGPSCSSRRGGWRGESAPITAPQFQFSLVNLVPNARWRADSAYKKKPRRLVGLSLGY